MTRRALKKIIDALLVIAAFLLCVFFFPIILILDKLLGEEEE